jgi:LmbE family N-acetylglucosaminyl deacetylase
VLVERSWLNKEGVYRADQVSDRFAGARALAIVAHYDDEVLFCGGLLSDLRSVLVDLVLVVVTSIETTSAPREVVVPGLEEIERRRRRLAAFAAVRSRLDAHAVELRMPNLSQTSTRRDQVFQDRVGMVRQALVELVPLEDADLVVTHGFEGEYGHPQHCCVHDAVTSLADSSGLGDLWTFSGPEYADLHYRHDTIAKRRLLEYYRQRVDGSLWTPESDVRVQRWTGADEWYSFRSVVKV